MSDKQIYRAYLIENSVNKKKYVGITTQTYISRWRRHKSDAINGRGYKLHKSMKRIGISKFKFTPLFETDDWDEINKYEKNKIIELNTINKGYNLNLGGSFGDGKGKAVIVNGKKFISMNAAARYYNFETWTIHQRVSKYGWTLKQALGIHNPPEIEIDRINITVNGKHFKNFRAACKFYQLNEDAVRSRLNLRWTIDEAFGLEKPPNKGRNSAQAKKIKVEGVTYTSISKAAEEYEISKSKLADRLRSNWSINQAFEIDEPPPPSGSKNGTVIVVNGKKFKSITDAEKFFNIRIGLAGERLNRGWTKNQAFNLKQRLSTSGEKNGIPIKVNGKLFSSMKKASKFYEIDNRKVWKRINKYGWSINEAFELKKRK